MISVHDIEIGQIYDYPDTGGNEHIVVKVIDVKIVSGNLDVTLLEIIESSNPEDRFFGIGKQYSEMSFVGHINKGIYILRQPRLEPKSRIAYL